MSLDLSGAQAALSVLFMPYTLRLAPADATRLGVPATSRCGLSSNANRVTRNTPEGRDQGEGAYTLSLPADTALNNLPLDLIVTIDEKPSREFRIGMKQESNLNLTVRYACDERR